MLTNQVLLLLYIQRGRSTNQSIFRLVFAFALIDVIFVFSLGLSLAPGRLAYLPDDFRTFFFSVSTHPVTDESVVGISVNAAREFAAFVPTFSPRRNQS